jgi:hypothetical protein
MAYTNVPKPTSTSYNRVTFSGHYIWDDSNVFYDDPNVYWDGVDISAYTNIAKPTSTTYTNIAKPV